MELCDFLEPALRTCVDTADLELITSPFVQPQALFFMALFMLAPPCVSSFAGTAVVRRPTMPVYQCPTTVHAGPLVATALRRLTHKHARAPLCLLYTSPSPRDS